MYNVSAPGDYHYDKAKLAGLTNTLECAVKAITPEYNVTIGTAVTIMNMVEKGVPLKTGVATLFGGGVFYPATAFKSVGGAAIGAGSLKSAELAYRFLTNPTLRHYYNQVLSNAIRENGPATVKALVQLDKHYQKELNDPNSNLNRQMQPYPAQMQTKQQKEHPSQVDKTSLLYRGY